MYPQYKNCLFLSCFRSFYLFLNVFFHSIRGFLFIFLYLITVYFLTFEFIALLFFSSPFFLISFPSLLFILFQAWSLYFGLTSFLETPVTKHQTTLCSSWTLEEGTGRLSRKVRNRIRRPIFWDIENLR